VFGKSLYHHGGGQPEARDRVLPVLLRSKFIAIVKCPLYTKAPSTPASGDLHRRSIVVYYSIGIILKNIDVCRPLCDEMGCDGMECARAGCGGESGFLSPLGIHQCICS